MTTDRQNYILCPLPKEPRIRFSTIVNTTIYMPSAKSTGLLVTMDIKLQKREVIERTLMTHSSVRTKARTTLAATFIVLGLIVGTLAMAQSSNGGNVVDFKPSVHATHILGFAGTPANTSGTLAIEDQSLRFDHKKTVTLVRIDTIENIFLCEQDKQVGGIPMTLGKAATPFGGGRVVSLFSHKKYDDVTLLYRDDDGGLHAAVFQVQQGQGAKLKEALVDNGARASAIDKSTTQRTTETHNATK